jgi:hypothetical protein
MQSRRLWFEADPVFNGIKKPLHAAEVAFCLSERIFSPRGTGTVPALLRPGDEAKLRFKGDRAGRLHRSPNQKPARFLGKAIAPTLRVVPIK